ncbi:MAG: Smr/MutS family protein [Beijerinckiaceae bacterium]
MRRRGKLSDEELALWVHVASQVRPLPGRKVPVMPKQLAERASETASVTAIASSQPITPAPNRLLPMAPIERRLRQRVTRGQAPIDGVLDLHGMRQDEAHRALLQFVQRKHHEGAALVMIITGKGSSSYSDSERGVLKRLVPHWLSDPGLRRCIIGFEDAAQRHGGTGALYVRIRRARELV